MMHAISAVVGSFALGVVIGSYMKQWGFDLLTMLLVAAPAGWAWGVLMRLCYE